MSDDKGSSVAGGLPSGYNTHYGSNFGQPLQGQPYSSNTDGNQGAPGYYASVPPPPPYQPESAPPAAYMSTDPPYSTNQPYPTSNPRTAVPQPPAPMPNYNRDLEEAEAANMVDKDDEPFASSGFNEKSIRLGFVRKVFGILTVQLLVTFGAMALFVYYEPLREFTERNQWIWIVAITFVIIFALACCGNLRRKSPYNFIFLALFTLAWAWMLGSIAAKFRANEVWMAVGIVCAITLCMCILGMQTKIDLTWTVGLLMILLVSLIGFGIICAIIRTRYAYLALAAGGAGLFSIWLLVDIQLIMGGHGVATDPEEYVFAALNIYLDVINILLRILIILNIAKS